MKAVVIGESSGASMDTIMAVKEDPFILEGLARSFVIRDWNDTMLE